MPKRPPAPTPSGVEPTDPGVNQRTTAICLSVLAALGRPSDFLRITIRQVTGDDFRVNVVTGDDVTSARIAHSYFVTADEGGIVTHSTPGIVRLYPK
jgi:hypothetical protein